MDSLEAEIFDDDLVLEGFWKDLRMKSYILFWFWNDFGFFDRNKKVLSESPWSSRIFGRILDVFWLESK